MAEYILRFEDPNAGKIELTGGKGSSLAYLGSIEGISVPEGFCISTAAYDSFIRQTALEEKIKEFDQDVDKLTKKDTGLRAANLRGHFMELSAPEDVQKNVKKEYRSLCDALGYEVEVAVRSSATTEDLASHSFAGQHDTYLNIKGENNVVEAVKKCWASFYTDRAINYRKENGFLQCGNNLKMSVVVQRMINPQAAGVAFNIDQTTAYEGIVIEVNYGLGESLVGGGIVPDRFVVHKETLQIIKAQKGSKEEKVVYKNNGGTQTVDVPLPEREEFALPFPSIKEIADSVNKIEAAYSKRTPFLDTEFAVDQEGILYLLQARPATLDLKVVTVEEEAVKSAQKILEGGTKATRKAASGVIKIIPTLMDLKESRINVELGDIVVTDHTWNEWTEYLRGMKGIITRQGGTLCHAAIISREWGIPGLVGCDDAVEILEKYESEQATLDANRRIVYLGNLPLVEMTADCKEESKEVKVAPSKKKKFSHQLGMIDDHGGWIGRPNYPLGKLQLEIYDQAFDRLDEWLELDPVRKKIVEDILYTSLAPSPEGYTGLSKKLKEFPLEKLEEIYEFWVQTEREYLEAAESLELSKESFENFIDSYTWMNTFMDMAFAFNSSNEKKLRVMAEKKRMPQTFYDEALVFLEGIVEHEDVNREKDAVELGREIRPLYEEGREPLQVFERIKSEQTDLAEKIITYAKSYRFSRSDLRSEVPLKRVMERLIETIENGLNPPQEYERPAPVQYLPEEPDFQRLLELAVKGKIQANNFHHTKPRGQWKFRDAMLDIGRELTEKGILDSSMDIFEKSINEVIKLVKK